MKCFVYRVKVALIRQVLHTRSDVVQHVEQMVEGQHLCLLTLYNNALILSILIT